MGYIWIPKKGMRSFGASEVGFERTRPEPKGRKIENAGFCGLGDALQTPSSGRRHRRYGPKTPQKRAHLRPSHLEKRIR